MVAAQCSMFTDDTDSEDDLPLNIVKNGLRLRELFEDSSDGSDFEGFEPENYSSSSDDSDDASDSEADENFWKTEASSMDTDKEVRWRSISLPENVNNSDRQRFQVRNPGPRNLPPQNSTPIHYFYLFFNVELFTLIIRETNRYARSILTQLTDWVREHVHSHYRRWVPVTVAEMKKYIGLCINMGLIKKKMSDYWSKRYSSQDTPFFRRIMSKNRFFLISRMFHLNDNDNRRQRGDENFDPWHKVRPVMDHLNTKFKHHYIPSRDLSIDESMIGMKNRHAYIQYVPNKRHNRFGIKKFEVCEAKTGYVLHTELYSGRDFDVRSPDGQGSAVVMYLMQVCDLLRKGYHLITDNFYTKLKLVEDLLHLGTFMTGTVRNNSRGFPRALIEIRLYVGETRYMRKGDILALAFRDKKSQRKPVLLLSSTCAAVDHPHQRKNGEQCIRPEMIKAYNAGMGGVDLMDRKIYQIAAERPTHRYWVKVFANLLDMSLRNAYELYLQNTDGRKLSRQNFVAEIVEELCGNTQADDQIANDAPLPAHRLCFLVSGKERNCVVCSTKENR
ncbi:piggyBac transposable element-derived protein 4-like [Neoarius graeffei]|uniref:piggyBac transposable element-derived protein 4-like n=1 Tax=Neoarius graeffei TaxID=443677 RepID=UPI00298CE08E|nr:piggyBac transposable element-derived protein 4-like [Neoarius graeffei]